MMRRHRKILIVLSVVSVLGLLSTALGYALHLRSDVSRRSLEERLSKRLGVKLSIGSVTLLSLSARRLSDIRAELPQRGVEVFRCREAVWRDVSRDGERAYALQLSGGWLLVGANEWDRSDYRKMLHSSLGHDFTALGLRSIELVDIDLQWKHPRMTFTADRTTGRIRFDDDGTGRASLSATRLNGVEVAHPIKISARFTPGTRLRFHEVVLDVSEAPLSALNLDELVGETVTCGRFAGNVSYRDDQGEPVVSVSGAVYDALLSELTSRLPGGPYDGQVDVVVDDATFGATSLRSLRFSGELTGLDLSQVTAGLTPGLDGRLDLRVDRAVYRDNRIEQFNGSGRAAEVPLGPLTELIGRGRATGTLEIIIHSLAIVDDRLTQADVAVNVVPPAGGPGMIDRDLLESISRRALGFDVTTLLPEHVGGVEYRRFGARLQLQGEELRVLGTHGPDNKTILTLSILGQDLGVVKEPANPFHIGDLLSTARQSLGRYDLDQLRAWLGFADGSPATADRNHAVPDVH
ncbi:MAG: hypothetical protein V3W34_15285 [Phycisphaerae bacterium]